MIYENSKSYHGGHPMIECNLRKKWKNSLSANEQEKQVLKVWSNAGHGKVDHVSSVAKISIKRAV